MERLERGRRLLAMLEAANAAVRADLERADALAYPRGRAPQRGHRPKLNGQ